ncbi:hypothetical protein M409DRAFT_27602 [Zasmidium cellare ATCC 36951]|uniref:Uncharacterized protein n=1 Tax=Zasmidium cellare ATCC 36951 TaxID=1080233 RepID=A0A6A6C431_ZASCE|nr:uncharacterized protein M409DRAFT_27602 [Zasmidium cellare ATCC 36951]KAF2161874.1 hypothetical protein M409DRAFT_27602 [Zasmidium cellare ATCC 36951]
MTLFPGVALITGAASGIGRATALSFAREGCRKLALADLNTSGLEETAKAIHEAATDGDVRVVTIETDVSEEGQVEGMVERTVRELGRVDYAVNAAGILTTPHRSHDLSPRDFDHINAINYRGCWLSSRAEIAQMRQQEPLDTHDGRPGNRGAVVNVASQLGIVGRSEAAAYCASKAAVISMTRCDAIDYSKDNIRVNCICPGVIDTPMTRPNMTFLSPAISLAPLNRPGTAQEIADAVLFLASPKASFVQGAAMVVDGGYTIN